MIINGCSTNVLGKELIWEPCFLDYKISEIYFSFLQPTTAWFSQGDIIPCHSIGYIRSKLGFEDKRENPTTKWSSLLPWNSLHVHVSDEIWSEGNSGTTLVLEDLFPLTDTLRIFWCHFESQTVNFFKSGIQELWKELRIDTDMVCLSVVVVEISADNLLCSRPVGFPARGRADISQTIFKTCLHHCWRDAEVVPHNITLQQGKPQPTQSQTTREVM